MNENFLNYLNLKKTFHVRNENFLGPKKEIDGLSGWTFKWVPMGFFIWNFQNFPSFYVSSYGEIIKFWAGWFRVWLKWGEISRDIPPHFNQTLNHPLRFFYYFTIGSYIKTRKILKVSDEKTHGKPFKGPCR